MSKRMILSLAALMGATLCLNAQSFQEGFFLRHNNLAYQYNPAFVGDNNFLSVGQINYNVQNNVGAGSFLFPKNDVLVTGFHSAIPAEVFPGKLPENCRQQGDLNATIFAYGFHKANAFHTLELNVRGMYGLSVPRQAFEFLKKGTGSSAFDMGQFRVTGNLFAEVAYGYGRKLNDWLSVGARAKLLLPLYGMRFDISDLAVTANTEELSVNYKGNLYMTNRSGKMEIDEAGYVKPFKFSNKEKLGPWPAGAGLGLDLGLVAMPVEGLTVSLSMLDLGGMYWYYGNRAASSGPLTFEGLENLTYEQLNADDLKSKLLDIGKEFLQVMRPVPKIDQWQWQALHLQANLGVKYEMPFYRRLAVGATGRYLGSQGLPYWEGRFGLEVNPWDWLDLTADIGTGSRGMVWGVAAAVRICRFRITAGMQNGFGGTIPYSSRPIEPNFKSLSFGLSYDL